MNLEKYPISLREVVFTKSSVIAIPNHQPAADGVLISPENSISVNEDPENPHHFIATMRTIVNKEMLATTPYFIDMECIASFTTDGSLSPEDELRGVTINGHSVCYGAIREAVSWLTSRQPYGPIALGLSVLRGNQVQNESPKS